MSGMFKGVIAAGIILLGLASVAIFFALVGFVFASIVGSFT